MSAPNANLAWAMAWIDELARSGISHAVVSPGSRSGPLALAFASDPRITTHVWLDERAAAFFALGLARATRGPVALTCTSGTAVANQLPALVEASHSQIPLVSLTADRPPELQECGAAQTIDQREIFGSAVRWFVQAPLPELSDAAFAHARTLACRAVATATGMPPGPVHVNLPFRDPLDPRPDRTDQARLAQLGSEPRFGREGTRGNRSAGPPWVTAEPVRAARLSKDASQRLAAWIAEEPRGWIVAGPLESEEGAAAAVGSLAVTAGWPLLADPLSQLRSGGELHPTLVATHDAVLRAERFADAHAPRRVLRFGAMPTSKSLRTFLERHPEIEQRVVAPYTWLEPTHLAASWIRADAREVASALSSSLAGSSSLRVEREGFLRSWVEAGRRAEGILAAELDCREQLSEPGVVRTLASALVAPATLFVASSMPIRDVDAFWPSAGPRVRMLANRGANGIDGTLACALATARMTPRGESAIGILGDQALLHDIGSARAARDPSLSATILVIDNDGGGIFEFLPVATSADAQHFEQLFATPHRMDLERLLAGFELPCTRATSPGELRDALRDSLGAPGVQFIRVPTQRGENRELHAKLFARVRETLDGRLQV